MDKQQASQLIKETFENAFEEKRYIRFITELLNGQINVERNYDRSGQVIKDSYKDYVSRHKRLGLYTDSNGEEIDLIVVYLKRENSLDRARTMQRNFAAELLKGKDRDTAIIAYVTNEGRNWRFSMVRREPVVSFSEAGNLVSKDQLTPVRRYSFLVGENEPNHTAQQQLLPILVNDKDDPTLDQLENAFNIETVTKEFFERYKSLYLQLKEELDQLTAQNPRIRAEFIAKELETTNFAKKLLGQIVFLYFLQKKGWLGVDEDKPWGTGPKTFLRGLFDAMPSDKNFFNDILEPLFYEALAIERSGNLYSRLNTKIPFLNGGLFEPVGNYDWRTIDVLIDNGIFKNIFDTFDLYNFTVREDEPLEKEVAVDPEMLGKVFENLLEVTDRKSKGAFYTPREIVHYMCQESLINYLSTVMGNNVSRGNLATFIHIGELAVQNDTAKEKGTASYEYQMLPTIRANAEKLDKALENIRICDPAIGSGAFPVGMMQEIIKARNALTTYMEQKNGRTNYSFKRHAIQESIYGVDIDSGAIDVAKLRLWLSLIVDEDDYQDIKPLPNLDYKIVCGNSLSQIKKDIFNDHLFKELEQLKQRYFNETIPEEKLQQRAQINALIAQLTGGYTHFDMRIYFSEVFHNGGGFDVVIANPPYVRMELIKDLKFDLKSVYEDVYAGRADLYIYFFRLSFDILKPQGILTFITPNKFMRANYGKKLRDFLARKTSLRTIIDFGDLPIFDATTYPMITIIGNQPPGDNTIKVLEIKSLDTIAILHQSVDSAYSLPQDTLSSDGWQLTDPHTRLLMNKLKESGKTLGEYVNGAIYRGVVSGLNEAFVIDEAKRAELIAANPESEHIIQPFVIGRDLKQWIISNQHRYIIFTYHNIDIQRYPAIERHLSPFRNQLEARATSANHRWYELQQPQMGIYPEFENPKIVYQEISTFQSFAYDTERRYLNNKCFFIPTSDLFLLGLLNSTVIWFFLGKIVAKLQGGTYALQTMYMENIPIPKVPDELRNQIAEISSRCLVAAQSEPKALTSLSAQLNQLVYQAYQLDMDDIILIEKELEVTSVQKAADFLNTLNDTLKAIKEDVE